MTRDIRCEIRCEMSVLLYCEMSVSQYVSHAHACTIPKNSYACAVQYTLYTCVCSIACVQATIHAYVYLCMLHFRHKLSYLAAGNF